MTEECEASIVRPIVMAGLDPAIQLFPPSGGGGEGWKP